MQDLHSLPTPETPEPEPQGLLPENNKSFSGPPNLPIISFYPGTAKEHGSDTLRLCVNRVGRPSFTQIFVNTFTSQILFNAIFFINFIPSVMFPFEYIEPHSKLFN